MDDPSELQEFVIREFVIREFVIQEFAIRERMVQERGIQERMIQERMNSPLEPHEVRLRGLGSVRAGYSGAPLMGIKHSSRAELYVHLVWSTWDRHPLLTSELRSLVFDCIRAECARMKTDVVALGGVEDHVHVLVRVPATLSISAVVKQIKGSSSHLANHAGESSFKWQGGYAAFSVSRRLLASARDYVLHQEERHRSRTLVRDFEPL